MDFPNSTHPARTGSPLWRRHGALALVVALGVLIVGCEARNGGEEDQVTSDGSASQAAASQFADVVNSENSTTGYAWLLPIPPRPSFVARALEALSPIRTAHAAAGYSCGTATPTWTGAFPNLAYTPPTPCTLTYGSGATASIDWSGSWSLVFTGAGCLGGNAQGLIGSSAPCSASRTTATIQRDVTFSSHVYTTTWNTLVPSGYAQSVSGPVVGQCAAAQNCPSSVPIGTGQRSFTIPGTHVQYRIDGVLFKDHTVSTAAPIVVRGSGDLRTVLSGTVQMQHNLAQVTSTTSVLAALTYSTACPYPTGGSLRTTFSGSMFAGKVETIGFGPNCGDASITLISGTVKPVRLTN